MPDFSNLLPPAAAAIQARRAPIATPIPETHVGRSVQSPFAAALARANAARQKPYASPLKQQQQSAARQQSSTSAAARAHATTTSSTSTSSLSKPSTPSTSASTSKAKPAPALAPDKTDATASTAADLGL